MRALLQAIGDRGGVWFIVRDGEFQTFSQDTGTTVQTSLRLLDENLNPYHGLVRP